MDNFMSMLKAYFNLTLLIFIIIMSVILYFVDRKKFIENGDVKEEKIAKVLSYIYFFGGIGLYIFLRIAV